MMPFKQRFSRRVFVFFNSLIRGHLLFWKVLMLILAVSTATTLAIGFYLQYVLRDSYTDFLHDQAGTYLALVIDRIGVPPDSGAATAFSRRYPIDIRCERNGTMWRTDTGVAASDTLMSASPVLFERADDSVKLRRCGEYFYGLRTIDDWTYVIRFRSTPERRILFSPTVLLIIALTLLVTGTYLFVLRSMRPVEELIKGVQAIGSGDFEYRVPVVSRDELGKLTRAFNGMTQRVADIIASKRRLLFDVSHELRSPLTRMNVALAMLPESKAATTIERNLRELNTMITELLENERLAVLGGKLVVEETDVVALTRRVIELFGHEAHRITLDTLTETAVITVDVQRLSVALRNVIANALKYSADSGDNVNVAVFPDEHGLHIAVTDRGIGIPPEEQERVFEPFYRTDSSRSRSTGGYGLGLSLTKAIVDAHGGAIRLESVVGKGTTISIVLPQIPKTDAVVRTVTDIGS